MLFEILLSGSNFILGATSGQGIADGIRNFIGPILMLIMGIVAITFLFKREMTSFIVFLVIAIVVAIIFYAPGIIEDMGKNINTEVGGTGW